MPGDGRRLHRKSRLMLPFIVLLSLSMVAALYFSTGGLRLISGTNATADGLPAGCKKPAVGFLFVTTGLGWNDSLQHQLPWPVITATQGQTVDIVVCNADVQAHGFQVEHYYERSLVTIGPGQVLTVSFVTDKAGSFEIYCAIFCSIHPQMIAELNVLPS